MNYEIKQVDKFRFIEEGEGEILIDSNGTVSDFKIQNGRTLQELVDQPNVTVKVNRVQ